MRLLLTRAARDAARTRARLEAMGHEVLVSPVLDMRATDVPWPNGVVDAVLVTSAQAFVMLKAGPPPEAKRLMPLFLVGERTIDLAREHGFTGPSKVAPNAAALAADIESVPLPKRIAYLAGSDRKPDLEEALARIGVDLVVAEVYIAAAATAIEPAATVALHLGAIDGILHFSRRSAALFCKLAKADGIDVAPIPHFCLSDDVAEPMRKAGCAKLTIAEQPNEAALLAMLDGSKT